MDCSEVSSLSHDTSSQNSMREYQQTEQNSLLSPQTPSSQTIKLTALASRKDGKFIHLHDLMLNQQKTAESRISPAMVKLNLVSEDVDLQTPARKPAIRFRHPIVNKFRDDENDEGSFIYDQIIQSPMAFSPPPLTFNGPSSYADAAGCLSPLVEKPPALRYNGPKSLAASSTFINTNMPSNNNPKPYYDDFPSEEF